MPSQRRSKNHPNHDLKLAGVKQRVEVSQTRTMKERVKILDFKLGVGVGAARERRKFALAPLEQQK